MEKTIVLATDPFVKIVGDELTYSDDDGLKFVIHADHSGHVAWTLDTYEGVKLVRMQGEQVSPFLTADFSTSTVKVKEVRLEYLFGAPHSVRWEPSGHLKTLSAGELGVCRVEDDGGSDGVTKWRFSAISEAYMVILFASIYLRS